MSRCTAYTAAMATRLIAYDKYTQIGISPPEIVGQNEECVKYLLRGLKDRGVKYVEKIEMIKKPQPKL